MSDPIYQRYKDREDAKNAASNAAAQRNRENNDAERRRLLDSLPEEVAQALRRLETADFDDAAVKCMFRNVREESGDVHEAATWSVGRSDSWTYTREDQATDSFVLASDGRFWRTNRVAYPDSRTVHVPLDPSSLSLKELREMVQCVGHVGKRQSDFRR